MSDTWFKSGESANVILVDGNLVLGDNSPGAERITVMGTTLATAAYATERYSDNAFAPTFYFRKSRGATLDAHTIVVASDVLGHLRAMGSNGTSFKDACGIQFVCDANPGAGDAFVPGEIRLQTTTGGATALTTKLVVKDDGAVGIGIGVAEPAEKLEINGIVKADTGKFQRNTVTDTTHTTLSTDHTILVQHTDTAAVTVTLATSETDDEREFIIKDSGGNASSNNITIETEGAETIDGESSTIILSDYGWVWLTSDGNNWFIKSRNMPTTSWLGTPVTKDLTFSNDTGTVSLFTVTGDVIVKILPVVTTNVASAAAANMELGVVGDTDAMIVPTLATDLDAREIWIDASPTTEIEPLESMRNYPITDGNDVVLTLDAQVDSGAISFYCFWTPLSSDGAVTAA